MRRIIASVLPAIFLLAFTVLALIFVFSLGIGCGDDAWHAVIAKNLADGLGYTSTIQTGRDAYVALRFDPLVGTGPTVIIPASLVIRLVGNTFWAPGISHVLLWVSLFVSIGLLVRRYQAGFGLSFATFSFLYLSYALMTYHYEQWYALLGEVPAALLIILSVLIYFENNSKSTRLLSGVAMSLAVLAKFVSIFAFSTFLLVAATLYIVERTGEGFKAAARDAIYFTAGFIIPFVAFEIWKFVSLGPAEFIHSWQSFADFLRNQGVAHGPPRSLISLYKTRVSTLYERFGITFQSVVFLLALVGALVSRDKGIRRLYLTFTAMIIFYSVWWTFLSIGWARYYIIPLILVIGVASLPFLLPNSTKWVWLYLALLVIWPAYTWDRMGYPFSMIDRAFFEPSKETKDLLKASSILSQAGQEKVITEWWATAANLEYMSGSHLIFTTYRDKTQRHTSPYWIAADTKFVDPNDKEFKEMLSKCEGLKEVGGYLVGRCE
ncbi:MAG: hypothetical protein M0Z67_07435 [Nitrospiraceae bacterium]|nr:hypothetical protein [Nitrospiraceae bacterium]